MKNYILPVCLILLFAGAGNAAAQITPPQDQQCLIIHHTTDTDGDFMHDMLRQQQMSIDMAQKELLQGKNPAAQAMAQKILDDQTKEIMQMEVWLKKR